MYSSMKTGDLFTLRASIIATTKLMVLPFELMFDAVDDELTKRGHRVRHSDGKGTKDGD